MRAAFENGLLKIELVREIPEPLEKQRPRSQPGPFHRRGYVRPSLSGFRRFRVTIDLSFSDPG
jgi:hypothetical protein